MPPNAVQTGSELSALLSTGGFREFHTSNVEFKRKWDADFGSKISGLANRGSSSRAWLVVGVNDDGSLSGYDENWAEKTSAVISQNLNELLDPSTACEKIYSENINGKWVVVLEIVNPGAVVRWKGRAWKMPGTTLSEMTPAEVLELTTALPGPSDFTTRPWPGRPHEGLEGEYVRMLMRMSPNAEWMQGVQEGMILSRTIISGKVAARILLGDTKFRVIFYSGPDEIASNETRSGLLRIVSDEFLKEIQDWTRNFHRVAEPYPAKALKEALANCVAHTAYFENDGEIVVELFPDRLTVSNLCIPEVEYFANKWFSSAHKTVNKLLTEALREVRVVDELGRGKNRIFSESILAGRRPPHVDIEHAGRYSRWKLTLFDGENDTKLKRLLDRLQSHYTDRKKVMLAMALVLWRDHKLDELRSYIDTESRGLVAEILQDQGGPVFFYSDTGKVVLRRWARLLIEQGQESQSLNPSEELDLYNFMYELQMKFSNGYINPAEFRKLAQMSNSNSEKVLSSRILRKWMDDEKVEKIKTGLYRFKKKSASSGEWLKLFESLLLDPKKNA